MLVQIVTRFLSSKSYKFYFSVCVIPFSFDYIPKNRQKKKNFKEYIFFPFAFLYQHAMFNGKFKTRLIKSNLKSSQNTLPKMRLRY